MQILGAGLYDADRFTSIGGAFTGFPPKGYALQSIRGHRIVAGDNVNYVVGVSAPESGYGLLRGIIVYYRAGGKEYRVFFNQAYTVCTPWRAAQMCDERSGARFTDIDEVLAAPPPS